MFSIFFFCHSRVDWVIIEWVINHWILYLGTRLCTAWLCICVSWFPYNRLRQTPIWVLPKTYNKFFIAWTSIRQMILCWARKPLTLLASLVIAKHNLSTHLTYHNPSVSSIIYKGEHYQRLSQSQETLHQFCGPSQ